MSDGSRAITTLEEALEEIARLRAEVAALRARAGGDADNRPGGVDLAGSPEPPVAPGPPAPAPPADPTPPPVVSVEPVPAAPVARSGDALDRLERLRESIVTARKRREQAVAEFHALVRPATTAAAPDEALDDKYVDTGFTADVVAPTRLSDLDGTDSPAAASPTELRSLMFGTTEARPAVTEPWPAREPERQHDPEDAAAPVPTTGSGFRFAPVLVALLIPTVAIVLLGWWWRSAPVGESRPPASAPAAPAAAGPPTPAVTPSPAAGGDGSPAATIVTPVPVPLPAGAAAMPSAERTPPPFVVELVTTRQVWLRVIVDGERRFERLIPAGERFLFEASRDVDVRAGDAGAVDASVAGAPAAPLGADGQVVTRIFRPGDQNVRP